MHRVNPADPVIGRARSLVVRLGIPVLRGLEKETRGRIERPPPGDQPGCSSWVASGEASRTDRQSSLLSYRAKRLVQPHKHRTTGPASLGGPHTENRREGLASLAGPVLRRLGKRMPDSYDSVPSARGRHAGRMRRAMTPARLRSLQLRREMMRSPPRIRWEGRGGTMSAHLRGG